MCHPILSDWYDLTRETEGLHTLREKIFLSESTLGELVQDTMHSLDMRLRDGHIVSVT